MPSTAKRTNVASQVERTVLGELHSRKGFDNWWEEIDEDIRAEIRRELRRAIRRTLRRYYGKEVR